VNEDSPITSRLLTGALTSETLTVDCMHERESAGHGLRTRAYALVILDIGLSRLDGTGSAAPFSFTSQCSATC
jgi:two-component system response regulator TctD